MAPASSRSLSRPTRLRPARWLLLIGAATIPACTAADYRDDADEQVYGILDTASEHVTGEARPFSVERPIDTLRRRLIESPTPVKLSLSQALDVAAENSRDFQRQKEVLYFAALSLTREQNNFSTILGGGGSQNVSGTDDDSTSLRLSQDLSASRNGESGGRLVASFVNSFFKDLINGGSFNGSSVLSLTLTQPLLRGFGYWIAREPLTAAERNVIYAMRTFERFRATFSVRVVSDYYRVLQQIDNLASETSNADGTVRNRERVQANVEAGRLAGVDLDRASQQEFDASDRLNRANAQLESTLDRFKSLLGLPITASIELDLDELTKLREMKIEEIDLDEEKAIRMALARRLDHRTVVDDVEDAARAVMITENGLNAVIDFSSAIDVPTEAGKPLKFDWDRVDWAAGFDIDLALNRINQRNSYRQALINFNAAIRARESSEDDITQQVRLTMRDIRRVFTSYKIRSDALTLSTRRLERARDFLDAGRGDTLALLDAQEDLLGSKLNVTGAIVDYAIARMNLLTDLEGLVMATEGLRYDPTLPLPEGPLTPYRASPTAPGALPPSPERPANADSLFTIEDPRP